VREGPFLVASVPGLGVYPLSFENGQPAKNGQEIAETDLIQA
jgi:hypothetical protein